MSSHNETPASNPGYVRRLAAAFQFLRVSRRSGLNADVACCASCDKDLRDGRRVHEIDLFNGGKVPRRADITTILVPVGGATAAGIMSLNGAATGTLVSVTFRGKALALNEARTFPRNL